MDCRKRMGMWVGKCCTGRENRKNNWGKVQNCPQNIHNLKKIAVDNKKIPGKKWGISCE